MSKPNKVKRFILQQQVLFFISAAFRFRPQRGHRHRILFLNCFGERATVDRNILLVYPSFEAGRVFTDLPFIGYFKTPPSSRSLGSFLG